MRSGSCWDQAKTTKASKPILYADCVLTTHTLLCVVLLQSELAALRASALDLQQREAALANQQHAVAAAEAAVTRERQMLARERQQLQVWL
jgi:hypothetical protein